MKKKVLIFMALLGVFGVTRADDTEVRVSTTTTLKLDLRTGVRETLGVEDLTYSTQWSGGENSTVKLTVDGFNIDPGTVIAEGLSGEGSQAWTDERLQVYTMKHTTYTDGVAGEVLTAQFEIKGEYLTTNQVTAVGYTNVYDGVSHSVKVTTSAKSLKEGQDIHIRYAMSEEGPYLPNGENFTFKDVVDTNVWYFVVVPGYYPVTNKIGVCITKAPLTITANEASIYNGQSSKNEGVSYSGFVAEEDETSAGLKGSLNYTYGGYGLGSAAGDYNITPSGLSASNYEITYKTGPMHVKTLSVQQPATMKLDLRTGVRETLGVEDLTYSTQWSGSDNSTATITVDGFNITPGTIIDENLTGEGETRWTDERLQVYTMKHTTYTDGVAGEVLTAQFEIKGQYLTTNQIVAVGYTNVYDGVEHSVNVSTTAKSLKAGQDIHIRYAMSEEGPYLPNGENFTFKDVVDTNVWYFVVVPGYYPVTNKIGVCITKAPLTITANESSIYNGQSSKNEGVSYSGFVADEDETTAGLKGSLNYTYGGYGLGSAAGDYNITPSGLSASNYEITYKTGPMHVKTLSVQEPAKLKLDLRTGIRESNGAEAITYSDLWSKGASSPVTLNLNGKDLFVDRSEEGTYNWSTTEPGLYTFTHIASVTSTSNEVLTAIFNIEGSSLGGDAQIEWTNTSATPWVVTNENPLAAYSGAIGNSQSTTLLGSVAGSGTLTFERMVSSEGSYDFLTTKLDGTQQEKISGTVAWASQTWTVTGDGEHTFEWTYSKDGSTSRGDDRASIRNVVWTPDVVEDPIRATGYEGDYDGQPHGILVETDIEGVTITYSLTEGGEYDLLTSPTFINPSSNTVWFKVSKPYHYSYFGSARVIIHEVARENVVTKSNVNTIYDGMSHEVSVTALEGSTITYALTAAGEYGTTAPSFTDVVSTQVWYRVEKSGYETATGSVAVTITPKALTLTAPEKEKSFDGTPLTFTADEITAEGYVEGETLDYSQFASQTAVGVSQATFVASDSTTAKAANYTITYVTKTLTVTEASIGGGDDDAGGSGAEPGDDTLVVPEDGLSKFDVTVVYDGTAHTLNTNALAAVTLPGATPTFSYALTAEGPWSAEAPAWTDVTTTSVWYRISAANYADYTHEAKVTITPKALTLTSPEKTKAYDGTSLTFTASEITAEGYVDGECLAYSGFALQTAVGSIEATFVVADSTTAKASNYAITVVTNTLTVTASEIQLLIEDTTATYSGTTGYAIDVTVVKPSEGAVVKYAATAEGPWVDALSYTNACAATPMYVQVSASNYATVVTNAFVTVLPADLADYADAVERESFEELTYNGQAQEPALFYWAPVTANDVSVSYTNNVNAGEATIKLVGQGNFTGSVTIPFTIEKKALTLTAPDKDKVYDGSALTFAAGDVTDEGYVAGETLAYSGFTSQTDVGSTESSFEVGDSETAKASNYDIEIVKGTLAVTPAEVQVIVDDTTATYSGTTGYAIDVTVGKPSEGATVKFAATANGPWVDALAYTNACAATPMYVQVSAPNYATVVTNALVTVLPADLADFAESVERESFEELTYNGQAQEPALYFYAPVTANDVTVLYENNVDAGEAEIVLTGRNNFTGTLTIPFTIEKKPLTLTSPDKEKVFDGEALTFGADEIGADGFVDGESFDYANFESITAVGSVKSTFAVLDSATAKQRNYEIEYERGSLTVTAADLADYAGSVTRADAAALTYNGRAQEPKVVFTDPVTADDVTVSYENNVDAGAAEIVLTGRNNFTGTVTIPFTIEKRALTLTSPEKEKVYDGAPLTFGAGEVVGDGYVAGETLAYSGFATRTAVGSARATFTVGDSVTAKASNYAITVVTRTLTVTEATLDDGEGGEPGDGEVPEGGVSKYDVTVVYDGEAHTLDLEALGALEIDGAKPTVRFALTAEGEWLEEAPAWVDAGVTSVWYRLSVPNYSDYVHAARVTILPRELTLTAPTKTRAYTGEPLTFDAGEVTAEGYVAGETLAYGEFTSQTVVGSTEATFTVGDSDTAKAANYTVEIVPGTLTVTEAGIVYTAADYDAPYDGRDNGIIVETETPGAVVTYALDAEGPFTATKPTWRDIVDTTRVWFRITAPNYTPAEGSQTVRITQRQVTDEMMQLGDDVFFFDGTEKKPDVIVVDGDPSIITEDDYEITIGDKNTAGLVPVTLVGKGNYTGTVTKDFEILKRPVAVPTLGSKIYTGSRQRATITSDSRYTLVANEGGVDVGDYPVLFRLTNTEDYHWKGYSQDEDTCTATFTITKRTQNRWVTQPSLDGWAWGDEPATPKYQARFGNDAVQVTYDGKATLPTKPGTYVARFWLEDSANYVGLAAVEVTFTIEQGTYDPSDDARTETEFSPRPVPYVWLDPYMATFGQTDYEEAAMTTGKNGVALWESYVAGLDPTDPTSRFISLIEMKDEIPVITWTPDLGDEREYTVHGKKELTDATWEKVDKTVHHFFRVTVDLKTKE